MAIYKNKSSQKVAVFAYDSTDGSAKTGDAANITAQISLDGAATAATNDTNPTELDATDAPGVYLFDLTQAESNADLIVLAAVSATSDILLEPLLIYTEPETREANATQISGSSTAADNAELAFDGTGYGFTNCVMPTVTTNTDMRGTDSAALASSLTDGTIVVGTLNAAALADLFNTDSGTVYGSSVSGSVVKEIADNAGGGTPPTAAAIADAVWTEAIADHSGTSGSTAESLSSAAGGVAGSGGDTVTLTINDGGANPVADCAVWITSDQDGDTVVAGTKYTDQSGQVAFNLDGGTTYYCWRQKSGVNFTNPQSFVAVAD